MLSWLCQNCKKKKKKKKWEGVGVVFERTCPEEHPKSEKNEASLANKASVGKPKNIAVRSLK